jgi:hypothetical protein
MTDGSVCVVAASFGDPPGAQQIGVAEHRRGVAASDDLACQKQRFRVLLTDMLEVVKDGDHRPPFAMPVSHQRRQVANAGRVDGAIGLVEEDQRGILEQDAGEVRALQLTARERADRTALEAVHADQVDGRGNAFAPGAVEAAKGTDLAPQPHGHEVVNDHRKAAVERRQLGQVSDLPALHAKQLDAALQRPQFAGDAFEQRRFAGAVGTNDGQQAAGGNLPVQVVNRRMTIVAQSQIIEAQDRLDVP